MSVFLIIWHCILNADSIKTHSSSVIFLAILPAGALGLGFLGPPQPAKLLKRDTEKVCDIYAIQRYRLH